MAYSISRSLHLPAFDISSDLTELARTRTSVICAGAKSILDIGLTLEYLETMGVTVATLGETDDFPAFYARESGYKSAAHMRTPQEAAEMIRAFNKLTWKHLVHARSNADDA